jgi:hypothetical protein
MSISINVVNVTPEVAKQWLAKNLNNRKVRPNQVNKLTRDILNGKWTVNGETVKFDTNDRLIDGQHRLLAIIAADTPAETIVISGLAPEVAITLDQQSKRTMADHLDSIGEQSTHTLSGALRVLRGIKEGTITHKEESTISEIANTFKEFPDIKGSIHYVSVNRQLSNIIQPSITGALHCIFNRVNSVKCEEFFTALKNGIGLDKNDSRYILRERLVANRMNNNNRLLKNAIIALTVKAWNAYYDGTPIGHLRWTRIGTQREEFPKIRGFNDTKPIKVIRRRKDETVNVSG